MILTFLIFLSSIFTSQCSPSTNTIFTESGVGHANTYYFTVESPWKLDWTAEGEDSFAIFSQSLNPNCGRNCGGTVASAHLKDQQSGSTWVYGISGPMYLQIDGSRSGYTWTVEVSR